MKVKKLISKLENVFAAAAFAEAGEFDTARQIAQSDDGDGKTADKKLRHGKHEHQKEVGTPYPSKA